MLIKKPENRRWVIVGIVFLSTVFNYYDRQILAVLKPVLKEEFDMGDTGYAMLINVFTIFYALMYPVSGWMVDKVGPRPVMLFSIIGWSLSSFGAAISKNLTQLTFFRGVLGITEPANFPVKLKVVTLWFSSKARATANSLAESGSSIGAILAPPLAVWLTIQFNWHMAFIVGGVAGLIIALLWFLVYRDPPKGYPPDHAQPVVLKKEEGFSWKSLWTKKSLWGVILIRFISDPVWYFCLFWLPGYLQEQSGLSLVQIGFLGWIPFLVADIGAVGMSSWSDRMVKRGSSPLRSRRIMLSTIACFSPLCALTPFLPNAFITIAIFSIVGVISLTWLFNINIVVSETFPVGNVSSVLGIAGGFGALGAILMNYFTGHYIGTIGAEKVFIVLTILHPIAVLILWKFIRKEK